MLPMTCCESTMIVASPEFTLSKSENIETHSFKVEGSLFLFYSNWVIIKERKQLSCIYDI